MPVVLPDGTEVGAIRISARHDKSDDQTSPPEGEFVFTGYMSGRDGILREAESLAKEFSQPVAIDYVRVVGAENRARFIARFHDGRILAGTLASGLVPLAEDTPRFRQEVRASRAERYQYRD